jgi:ribose transport system permease protein
VTALRGRRAPWTAEQRRRWLTQARQRYALVVAWAALIVVFGILRPNTFLTPDNFASIFGSQAVLLVLTLALIVPLTCGDYDLSVASILSLTAMEVAVLNVNHGWPIGFAIAAALATGLGVGLVNGAIVVGFGLDSLIVTLGTGTFVQGVVYWISGSNTISGVSSGLTEWVILKEIFGIPIVFDYGLLLCVLLWYLLDFTPLGRRMLFVGRGRTVAQLSGVNVSRIRWGALGASGLISGLAGVLYVGSTGAADPTSGGGFLLPAFAAAFLGATCISPGRFNPWGSLTAVYFLVTGITGLQILGVQGFVQELFYGGALVIALALSQFTRKRRTRTAVAAGS